MQKKLALSAALIVGSIGSAFAADLPATKAPPIFVPPPPVWSGFYAGVNAGGAWDANSAVSVASGALPTPAFPTGGTYTAVQSALGASAIFSSSGGGFIGGGQVGYNWQFAASGLGGFGGNGFVAGIEADIQGLAGDSSSGNAGNNVLLLGAFPDGTTYFPGETIGTSISNSKRTDYIGTVRGRLGWLATPTLLLFGTGGLAYGGVSSQTSIIQVNNDNQFFPPGFSLNPLGFSSGGYSDTRVGWTAGAGAEWMFLPNWSAKIEYLYYDLGSVNYALSALVTTASYASGAFAVVTPQASIHFNGHIVRAGLNYHFNWTAPAPVVAKY